MLTLTDLEQAGLGARPPLLDTATSHRRPHVTTHDGWIAGLSPNRWYSEVDGIGKVMCDPAKAAIGDMIPDMVGQWKERCLGSILRLLNRWLLYLLAWSSMYVGRCNTQVRSKPCPRSTFGPVAQTSDWTHWAPEFICCDSLGTIA